MNRPRAPLLAVAALALLAAGVGWPLRLAWERGQVHARGSSWRSDADGARALYLLVEQAGLRPRRVARAVPQEPRGLLLALQPQPVSRRDNQELLAWLRAGSTLVLASAPPVAEDRQGGGPPSPAPATTPAPTPTPATRGERMRELLGGSAVETLEAALGLEAQTAHAPLVVPADSPLAPLYRGEPLDHAAAYWTRLPAQARVLLGSTQQPVLVEWPLAAGRVLALADARLLGNAGLGRGARLRLARWLVERQAPPVLFDEFRHGASERSGLAYVLARYGLLPAACALLLLLAFVAWRTTPAEAPPRPEGDEEGAEVRDALVDARAALYARCLRPRDALELLERDLRAGLSARLRGLAEEAAGPRAAPGALLSWKAARQRLHEKRSPAGPRLDRLLRELEAARRAPPASLEGLVPLARQVAAFLREVR